MGYGLSACIAAELSSHLSRHLKPSVVQAMGIQLSGQAVGWVADENRNLPNHPLDSALQVQRIANGCYEGMEFEVEEASWHLTAVQIPEGEDQEMAFPVSISHPIRALYNLYKNQWMLEHQLPGNPSRPPKLCWFELETVQRLIIDPAMWTWTPLRELAGRRDGSTESDTGTSLINYILADVYKALVLRKHSPPFEALGDP